MNIDKCKITYADPDDENTDKKYQIVYADPAWGFNFQKRTGLSDIAKNALYPTMSDEDIMISIFRGFDPSKCYGFIFGL